MPSGVCRHYPTCLVQKCRVTSDIKQTAAVFRTITVPGQEFCGVAFLLPGQTGRVTGVCVSDVSLGRPLGSAGLA